MKKMRFFILSFLFLSIISRAEVNHNNLLSHNDQSIFLSGMNLAWLNFANDLRDFNEELFIQRMDDLSEAGGNTVRWWLHTNGRNSPIINNDGFVTGIDPVELDNLEKALDIAYERGVLVMLCLWSFDMLQNNAGAENLTRNKTLLENEDRINSYIQNALIPMVERVKAHPGIISWEIFNEPEGMSSDIDWAGWTPETTTMNHVQRFVNLTAGAIRRTDPNTKISNGSWNILVLSDIGSFYNYYTDERLIAAGGDADGTLDFYMVHYYPEHFGTSMSPFHNPASHWDLDKPIVIGEFSAIGISTPSGGGSSFTTEEAYAYAIENGYAGALSWTMTGHDGHGDLNDARQAMLNLQNDYPDLINVIPDPDFQYPPFVKEAIPTFFNGYTNESTAFTVADLNTVFGSSVENMVFTFEVIDNTNEDLVEPFIENDELKLNVLANQTGMAQVRVRVIDSNQKTAVTTFTVAIYDPDSEDLLLNRRAFSSTNETADRIEAFAIDGNLNTRWSSAYSDNQWIAVEMEQSRYIEMVKLHWETAFGSNYEIQVSSDGEEWVTVYHETSGNGGWDIITFEQTEARFIRMKGNERATQWGFSIYAFQAFTESDGTYIDPIYLHRSSVDISANPIENNVHIDIMNFVGKINYGIYTISGVMVYQGQFTSNNDKFFRQNLNLSFLNSGYYIMVFNYGQESEAFKIIKN
ncbi:putative secreted protein (Por secretion system target) [Natronoflexus pectinivorans]|uniref:Putative secreted protein (Por secretion system target) n=2 Tax=Natronoflexus pectinivorans TaxID=682526 RepID=A0A4R2GK37_9BACT|nr:putative secreted protein (Por secretion system target) [Natronoflexus pectinivorans]